MLERLMNQLNTDQTPKVLLVGDFMLDNYLFGNTDRISPEAPVIVMNVTERQERPGGAGSVAVDLVTLGAHVACLGVIGNDDNGRRLRQVLNQLDSINLQGLLATDDRPTTFKQRIIGLAQHRHRQQLMRIDEESDLPLSAPLQQKLLEQFDSQLDWCDVVCLEDYNKGVLSHDLCQHIIAQAKTRHKPVLVDPARINDYSRYAGAWLVKPNRREVTIASGIDVPDQKHYQQAAQTLAQNLHIDNLVITLDKQGAFLYQRIGPNDKPLAELIPTRPRNVYDVTGAGDMVLATLAYLAALAAQKPSDLSVTDMVYLANVAGGLEVERFGAVGITRDEIIAELLREHRANNGKLRTLDALMPELHWHQRHNQKIVFTNGCFDLLHPGHVNLLSFAKAQGDILVVAINSDNSVRGLKGPNRPILKEKDRAALISALEVVDYVTIFDAPTPQKIIEEITPDVLIKGTDWAGAVVGQEWVESHGGQVVLMPLCQGFSTTNIIEEVIKKNPAQPQNHKTVNSDD